METDHREQRTASHAYSARLAASHTIPALPKPSINNGNGVNRKQGPQNLKEWAISLGIFQYINFENWQLVILKKIYANYVSDRIIIFCLFPPSFQPFLKFKCTPDTLLCGNTCLEIHHCSTLTDLYLQSCFLSISLVVVYLVLFKKRKRYWFPKVHLNNTYF